MANQTVINPVLQGSSTVINPDLRDPSTVINPVISSQYNGHDGDDSGDGRPINEGTEICGKYKIVR